LARMRSPLLRHNVKLIYIPNIAPNQSGTFAIERTSVKETPVPDGKGNGFGKPGSARRMSWDLPGPR